jgi:hypothetical protein
MTPVKLQGPQVQTTAAGLKAGATTASLWQHLDLGTRSPDEIARLRQIEAPPPSHSYTALKIDAEREMP